MVKYALKIFGKNLQLMLDISPVTFFEKSIDTAQMILYYQIIK